MNLNKTIILMTILIICVIGVVQAFLIIGGDNVVTIDTNSSDNNIINDTNITNQTTTPNTGNNSSTIPDPEPNEEPEPPEEELDQPEND